MGGPLSELVTGAVVAGIRIPIGLLLIVAGIVGFLPVLGFWMVPLGLLLIAQDIPFLRRPTLRALLWLERKWVDWKRRRSKQEAGSWQEVSSVPLIGDDQAPPSCRDARSRLSARGVAVFFIIGRTRPSVRSSIGWL